MEKIKAGIEQVLAKEGIHAEVTLCRDNMISVFCDEAFEFCKAKHLLSKAARYDSEDHIQGIGFAAYFTFL